MKENSWTDFLEKVKHWAEVESNHVGLTFNTEMVNDDTIRISATKGNKSYRLKYTRKDYHIARKNRGDTDILPVLFQILKEKFRPVRYSVEDKGRRSHAWPII